MAILNPFHWIGPRNGCGTEIRTHVWISLGFLKMIELLTAFVVVWAAWLLCKIAEKKTRRTTSSTRLPQSSRFISVKELSKKTIEIDFFKYSHNAFLGEKNRKKLQEVRRNCKNSQNNSQEVTKSCKKSQKVTKKSQKAEKVAKSNFYYVSFLFYCVNSNFYYVSYLFYGYFATFTM